MKNFIKSIFFILILILASGFSLNFFRVKNPTVEQYQDYLSNADVIILGSSHAYVNLSGAVMWEKEGLTTACLAQAEQNGALTYYMAESTLASYKPKLVVVEAFMFLADDGYAMDTQHYANALLSYPIYYNLPARIGAANLMKKYDDFNYFEYVLGFPTYHSSYYSKTSFELKKPSVNNYYLTAGYWTLADRRLEGEYADIHTSENANNTVPLSPENERYLTKIISLCKKKNIPLIIVVTPFQATEEQAGKMKTIKEMAVKDNVDFVDLNVYVKDMGFDLCYDMMDIGHSYYTGSRKNSEWLAHYLMTNYDLIDRRGDADYDNWNQVLSTYQSIVSAFND